MRPLPFEPIRIGGLEIENRFLMSAAVDGLAADPAARARRFSILAQGGVGLVVAGRVGSADELFGKAVEAVHKAGGKIALQLLSRAGLGFDPSRDAPAASVVASESPIFNDVFPFGPHHEAGRFEIEAMVEEFAAAARLAKGLGVDAVEIHAAHNSALMQYLTPLVNRRRDEWGGTMENRLRLHRLVYDAVRAEVGALVPIVVKLGVADVFPGGLTIEEGVVAAKLLAEHGYDAIEVSQGLQDFRDAKTLVGTPLRMHTMKTGQEAYFRDWCRQVKRAISKPAILTGGIRSFEIAEEVLSTDDADMIGMCRPLIREPGLVKRWREGDRKRATCISCNRCGAELMEGRPLSGVLERP